MIASLAPLPSQPADAPWPTRKWPTGSLAAEPARVAEEVCAAFFDRPGSGVHGATQALLMIHRGRLVLERYAADAGPDATLRSWSVAKSVTHALAGLLVGDGKLDVAALAPLSEWRDATDLRSQITIDHLLRMCDGLDFLESFLPGRHCDCIDMLFQSGSRDTAGYARRRPGRHVPGSVWNYSSGTTNVLCAIFGEIVGGGREGMQRFLHERLFAPLGMRTARPRFDAAGTFIGSSYVFASARDLARFGLLYLRDGVWEGRRLLPAGWVDHARTATPPSEGAYGAHWWLGRGGPGTFSAVGYQGQYLHLDPARDVIVVRLGVSTPEERVRVEAELCRLVASVPPFSGVRGARAGRGDSAAGGSAET